MVSAMWDSGDSSDPDDPSAADGWPDWGADASERPSLANAGNVDDADDATLAAMLRSLRAVPGPCAPPIGEGVFDILYASAREIVVWFASAKDGVGQKEVAIPTRLAREAWEIILRGEPVDAAALRAIAAGASGGSWLLALFAQLPSIEVRSVVSDDEGQSETVTLIWRGDADTTSRAS